MSEKEKLITAYHEGGHALVAAALPGNDPVHKVTILPRGRALGYTMVLPDSDKYSQPRSQMLDQLAYMLGGRAAEEMVFHDPTTGAGNDIEKATAVARAMVTQYGMTERLGAIRLGDGRCRAVPGSRHRPRAQLLRGGGRDRRRGDQEAPHQRRTRRPSTSSRRTATSSTRWSSSCSTRRPSTRSRSPRSSSRCAVAPERPAWTGSPDRRPSTIAPVEIPQEIRDRAASNGFSYGVNGSNGRLDPEEGLARWSPRPGPVATCTAIPPVGGRAADAAGPRVRRTDVTDDAPRAGRRAGVRPRARRGGRSRAADRDRGGPRA